MTGKISARLRKQGGFTLIELLVVVAIIGLLATLAMPRVFESIKKAKRAQGDADIHTISTAIEQIFMQSTNTKYPVTSAVAPIVTDSDIKDKIYASGLLKAHAKNLTNPFGKGYIYVTSSAADWYAVIDPQESTGDLTLKCNNTANAVAITVGTTFDVVVDTAIDSTLVKNYECVATNASGQKLTMMTN